jgi:hypothetical protein
VPKDYEDNPELGGWVGVQRRNYGKFIGEGALRSPSETIKARVQKLKEIGFDWGTTRSNDAWEERFVSANLSFTQHSFVALPFLLVLHSNLHLMYL